MTHIYVARLIPMSTEEEGFKDKSIEEIQNSFFIKNLKEQGNNYKYRSKGLVANDGDLVLFQMNNSIIASGKFKNRIKYPIITDSYHGELEFYKDSISVCSPIKPEELKKYCNNFERFTQMMQFIEINDYDGLIKRLKINDENELDDDLEVNKKRVKNKNDWLDILNNEKQEDNYVIDILLYMMNCKDHTSNGKNIASAFGKTAIPNLDIVHFGQRIVELKGIEEQSSSRGDSRYWNIPFTTVPSKNKNGIFTWRVRDELAEALIEKYNLVDNQINMKKLFNEFQDSLPEKEYNDKIKEELNVRNEFVDRFNINNIMSMKLNDYVTGRSTIDEDGNNSFCYLLESKMMNLGDMRGATAEKFGVYCAKETGEYVFANRYGTNLEEAFNRIKEEIYKLLIAGKQDDYVQLNESLLPPLLRGKLLSIYYPEKYICIFKEESVDKILNILDVTYDQNKINTLEKKRKLIKEYKDTSDVFNNCSNYYFVKFLYSMFANDIKEKHTVNGEIDYNFELIDFNYIGNHISKKTNTFRSRETDYERINRNKKDVGNRGENAVLKYEKNNLIKLDRSDLAELVEIAENDAIGYDIKSYKIDGTEKHIEVKTNSGNRNNLLDFYLTDNELDKMKSDPNYYIYYLYSIKSKPKLHIVNNDILLNKKEYLKPVLYKIEIDVEKKEDQ